MVHTVLLRAWMVEVSRKNGDLLRKEAKLMKLMWKSGLMVLCCMLLPWTAQAGGLFQNRTQGPVVLLGEVQSYGDYELKAAFFNTFADKLNEKLQSYQVQVINRGNVTNESVGNARSAEDNMLSRIHMDVIVHGHQFEYGFANSQLKHYADTVVGRAAFYDEEKVKSWQKAINEPYYLSADLQEPARQIAQKYGATELLFVNNKDVDVRLKGTVFATRTERETRGKKMRSRLDYYLIHVDTGLVYEGHCENTKTAQMMNFLIVKSGKGMNVDEMLNAIMETQTEDIAKEVAKKGLKAVSPK